jgi:NAD(P)-dependent dehydrogenase (short-subunit alcohol dehydrogenase family)
MSGGKDKLSILDLSSFLGKTIIVTGASSGLGKVIGGACADAGGSVGARPRRRRRGRDSRAGGEVIDVHRRGCVTRIRADQTPSSGRIDRLIEGALIRTPIHRTMDPGKITGAAVFLAASASDAVNGHILSVDGGARRLLRRDR